MDIHKPKAAHSWREFLIEIGTIICGIVIALGLEQGVESAHWSERVHEARESIHDELALASVFGEERLARRDCADARLAELAAAVVASPAQWRPTSNDYCGLPHATVYVSRWRPWPTEVWRTIEASGVVAHFDAHYRRQAPFVFAFVNELGDLSREERRLANDLAPLDYPILLTPDSRTAFLRTIATLRAVNGQMAAYTENLNGNVRDLGEVPTETDLKKARAEVPYLFVRPGQLLNRPAGLSAQPKH
jgi:hypothetical protein